MPNKPFLVSQTFPNSSYSLHLFHSNRPHSYSTKGTGKSLQYLPLSGAYKPFTSLSTLSLTFPSTHLLSITNLAFYSLVPPSIYLSFLMSHSPTHPSIHLPIHSSFHPSLYFLLHPQSHSLHLSAHHPFTHLPDRLPFHPLILPFPPIHPLIQSLIYSSSNLLISFSVLMLSMF